MKVQDLLDALIRLDPNTEILAAGFDNEEAYDMIAIDSMLTKSDGTKQMVVVLEPTGGDPVGTHDPYAVDDEEGDDPEACPGCGCKPGDGKTEGCTHPEGCGFQA